MPDVNIDPSAISNRATSSAPGGKDGTPAPSKPPPLTTSSGAKGAKPAQVCPRVDIEPLYTALKAGVGENWGVYKDGVSRFVLGHLSHHELALLLAPLALTDILLHTHNQLILALTTNVTREPPDPGVAPFVSAHDKPPPSAKPLDNSSHHRLKHEIMTLPPKHRARIKATADTEVGPLTAGIAAEAWARSVHGVGAGGVGGATPLTSNSGVGAGGLNKESEIRKRYHQSLMGEVQDLPTKSAIGERVLPIAYEEGLMSGVSQAGTINSLMAAALTTFMKETLGDWLGSVRADPPLSDPLTAPHVGYEEDAEGAGTGGTAGGVWTAGYKRKWRGECEGARRGKVKRNEMGLLPCEVQKLKAGNWGRGREGDVRLVWELERGTWRDLVPWAGERLVLSNEFEDEEERMVNGVNGVHKGLVNGARKSDSQMQLDGPAPLTNGDTTMTNHDRDDDVVAIDEMDWGWEGAAEPMALDDLLDGCLSV